MSPKEFRKLGYLQEVNRCFLHPLGLALSISIKDDGSEVFCGILDSRDDSEGLIYDLKNSKKDRIIRFQINHAYIEQKIKVKKENRLKKLGYVIEPIPRVINKL